MTYPKHKPRPRGNADRASKMLILADSFSEINPSLISVQADFVARRLHLPPSLAAVVAALAFSQSSGRSA